jgi:hypothetical protein
MSYSKEVGPFLDDVEVINEELKESFSYELEDQDASPVAVPHLVLG